MFTFLANVQKFWILILLSNYEKLSIYKRNKIDVPASKVSYQLLANLLHTTKNRPIIVNKKKYHEMPSKIIINNTTYICWWNEKYSNHLWHETSRWLVSNFQPLSVSIASDINNHRVKTRNEIESEKTDAKFSSIIKPGMSTSNSRKINTNTLCELNNNIISMLFWFLFEFLFKKMKNEKMILTWANERENILILQTKAGHGLVSNFQPLSLQLVVVVVHHEKMRNIIKSAKINEKLSLKIKQRNYFSKSRNKKHA